MAESKKSTEWNTNGERETGVLTRRHFIVTVMGNERRCTMRYAMREDGSDGHSLTTIFFSSNMVSKKLDAV